MLILLRHGQSDANERGLLAGRTESELTELGRRQARAVAPALGDVASLTSSPLNRAVETARLAVAHCQVELDVSFIEQDYGEFDGHPIADVPAQLWHEFRSSHGAALGGGESLADVDARVHARLDQMLEDSDSALHRADQHQVVVSHVSPIKSAVAWALGVDGSVAWRLRLDNASITTIAVRGGLPYLVTFNDVSARGGSNPIHR